MTSSSSTSHNSSSPPPPSPPAGQVLLFFLLLGWLVVAPVLVGGLAALLPALPPLGQAGWPPMAGHLLLVALLAVLLLLPLAGFAGLTRRPGWRGAAPLALGLLLTGLYAVTSALVRAVAEPGSSAGISLGLVGLAGVALALTGLGLSRAGLGWRQLPAVAGLGWPSLAGLAVGLALAPLLTIGWPVTGALGDSWTSLLLALQVLALTLPEEILFRGGLPGLLLARYPGRRPLAWLAAFLLYVASTPSLVVPRQEWSYLAMLLTAIPLALLLLELRALTGSIWAGLLVVWAYRAAPLLFTDPRVELPLLTQPWQTLAHLWMLAGAGVLALGLEVIRRRLASREKSPGWLRAGLAVGAASLAWLLWLGLWVVAGRPGFYNDGFLIIMTEQADLKGAEEIEDLTARRAFVRDRLIETAEHTQQPVRTALEAAGLPYRPFYIINMIRVEGHHGRMAEFAGLPGVARIMLNPNVRPYPRQISMGYGDTEEAGQGVGWNIRQTQADQVWQMGITGQGIVVAGQDTGYDWQHPALQRAYRGYRGPGEADHDYNWHDAWSDSPAPFDDDEHGTHTMGTILGDDGQGNQIGMAPGATWIGCRNMQRGLGNPASYADCMEFFLAPYPLGGNPFRDGDVTRAPHLVNNSWGCPDVEGCDDLVLAPATAALHAAGIMMIASAGNDGPACQTIIEPPARYDDVFSVGAINEAGQVTIFSSRGPVPPAETVPGEPGTDSLLLKPDIVAPGDGIRSSLPGGGYGTASGTSMAGPHVAGLVALLWSANPRLIGQIDLTETIIRHSAMPSLVSAACPVTPPAPAATASAMDQLNSLAFGEACACGGVAGTPNNVYGSGEINALAAVQLGQERP